MNMRALYYLGAGIGGAIGSFVPLLWGSSEFSFWAVLTSALGGFLGIWSVYKLIARQV